jgi:hypothetical protein
LTGAPIRQFCQIAALRASSRWTIRAQQAGGDPPAVALEAELVLGIPAVSATE